MAHTKAAKITFLKNIPALEFSYIHHAFLRRAKSLSIPVKNTIFKILSYAFLRSSFVVCQHSIVIEWSICPKSHHKRNFFSYKQNATTSISHFQNWEKFELRVSKENVPVMKNPPSQHQISKLIVLQPALEISPINQFMVEKLRNTHTTFQNRERQSMYTLGHV